MAIKFKVINIRKPAAPGKAFPTRPTPTDRAGKGAIVRKLIGRRNF